jgi:hypothetical protein
MNKKDGFNKSTLKLQMFWNFKDTCIDVINYMVLLSAYIADKDLEKKQEDTKETTIRIEPRLLKESPYSNNGCCKNTK